MVGGLFCDLQKAFDCVNHNILSTKLDFYGIVGTPYTVITIEGRYVPKNGFNKIFLIHDLTW